MTRNTEMGYSLFLVIKDEDNEAVIEKEVQLIDGDDYAPFMSMDFDTAYKFMVYAFDLLSNTTEYMVKK